MSIRRRFCVLLCLCLTVLSIDGFSFDYNFDIPFRNHVPLLSSRDSHLAPRAASTCSSNDTVSGRTLGYYQIANLQRSCDTVTVSQIDTTGMSHLYVAFAFFDPTNFTVVPATGEDVDWYSNFTSLTSNGSGVKVSIVIGGYSFNTPGTSTANAWSTMTSTSANRGLFIKSLASFMSTHSFNGVDLDWEFPGVASRGGSSSDTSNFVSLVREMRAAYNTTYGISISMPTSAKYLSEYNIPALEPYVDSFGFMTWQANAYSNTTTGRELAGPSDLRVLNASVQAIVAAGANLSQWNFGVSAYGRGYTLANTSCIYLGCNSTGPSSVTTCSQGLGTGVMSLTEINSMITTLDLQPQFLSTIGMMSVNYSSNQWMAYDDEYTFHLKKQFANKYCFGGLMTWSVDLNGGAVAQTDPAQTTTGLCGRQNSNLLCGNYSAGACCGSSGTCGKGTAFCGTGCQSGKCSALPVYGFQAAVGTSSASSGTATATSSSTATTTTTSTTSATSTVKASAAGGRVRAVEARWVGPLLVGMGILLAEL